MAPADPEESAVKPLEQLDLTNEPGVMPEGHREMDQRAPEGPLDLDSPSRQEDDDAEAEAEAAGQDAEREVDAAAFQVEDEADPFAGDGASDSAGGAEGHGPPPLSHPAFIDPLDVAFEDLSHEQLLEHVVRLRTEVMTVRGVAERLDNRLHDTRQLVCAIIDAAGGRIKVSRHHIQRSDADLVKLESGFDGSTTFSLKKPKSLWTPDR